MMMNYNVCKYVYYVIFKNYFEISTHDVHSYVAIRNIVTEHKINVFITFYVICAHLVFLPGWSHFSLYSGSHKTVDVVTMKATR